MKKSMVRIDQVPGFRITAVKAGIKKSGNLDLGLIVADKSCNAAGVFTQSSIVAAPVTIDRKHLAATKGKVRAILVNAGNANACTGKQGMADALACADDIADRAGCKRAEVLLCSTGVIGHHLPMANMGKGMELAWQRLEKGEGARDFVKAIMTTDLVPKEAGVTVKLGGKAVRIAGTCKGSGMIAPNMATMLAYILTDAAISPAVLQTLLREVADESFNAVTVDGDTSTNDTLLVLASGNAGNAPITSATSADGKAFRAGLKEVCYSLASQIARDGEGATKLVTLTIRNAASVADARKAARTIAESPLVKTALFGADPNWGRVLAAAGRSGAKLVENKFRVRLCGTVLFDKGAPAKFDAAKVSKAMKAKDIPLEVWLGAGSAEATMLTCDLTHGYITINADYHT